jgi:hypothetical protein
MATGAPQLAVYLASLAALLNGSLAIWPSVAPGETSGPGNQGMRNTASIIGQSGTAGNKAGVPRQQGYGTGGTVQGSIPT